MHGWMDPNLLPVAGEREVDPPLARLATEPAPSFTAQVQAWIRQHRMLVIVAVAVVALFLFGLGVHELGAMPEPVNSWYDWLHMHLPMGKWMWRRV